MNVLDNAGITMCTGNAGFAADSTTTVTNATAFNFCIDGKAYTKAITATITTPTTDINTGNAFYSVKTNKGSIFLFGVDKTGAVKAMQGEITDLDAGGAFISAPEFPTTVADGVCPFGYLVIKAGSTASAAGWVCGVNNMSGVTGITYTFVSIMSIPSRPQIS